MQTVEQIISDDALNEVFGYADFGSLSKRDVVKSSLLKCACGYHSGRTARQITEELGLVTKKWTLTKLGKEYLFAAFGKGIY